jgi:hypothetical protein
MKRKPNHKLKPAVFIVIVLISLWMILVPGIYSSFVSKAMIGIQTASAITHYGILGQIAPELNLNTWIDENGKKIEPIRLSDYRSKVVYLYFFQNW